MSGAEPEQAAPVWEWTATIERGVSLVTGAHWRGHRVRYRDRGTRRWRSFLLSVDDGSTPDDAAIELAIREHANR